MLPLLRAVPYIFRLPVPLCYVLCSYYCGTHVCYLKGNRLSLESCAAACANQGLPVAGVENGTNCFCGTADELASAAAKARVVSKTECEGTACQGNPKESECGAHGRLLAYHYTCAPPPSPSPSPGPAPPYVHVVPTPEVAAWQANDTGCFLVWNMATMVNGQGCRDEETSPPPLSAWQPTALDTDAWVQTCMKMGGSRIVFTAKHSCGFLAFRTKSSYNYSIAHTQYPDIDVAERLVASARKHVKSLPPEKYTKKTTKKTSPLASCSACMCSRGIVVARRVCPRNPALPVSL